MTQQAPDLVIEPQTSRYAIVSPGAEGLLCPEDQKPQRPPKFRQSRYVGLINNGFRRSKYADATRIQAHGGFVRLLTTFEIDEWYARLAAIRHGKHQEKLVGPLVEKSR